MPRNHVTLLGPGQPIELPRPARAAAPLAGLALAALALGLAPELPHLAALAAALPFALAAAVRAIQEQRALHRLRASADRLLLRDDSLPWSPLLAWRAGELTRPEARDRLAAAIGRTRRSASPSSLPGASPLNRGAARHGGPGLEALADRLRDPEPVSARGVLLVRRLLEEPSSPLYDRERSGALDQELEAALAALEHGSGKAAPPWA